MTKIGMNPFSFEGHKYRGIDGHLKNWNRSNFFQ